MTAVMNGARESLLRRRLARLACPRCRATGALIPARVGGVLDWTSASCAACYRDVPVRYDVVATEVVRVVWDATVTTDPGDEPGVHVDTDSIERPEGDS